VQDRETFRAALVKKIDEIGRIDIEQNPDYYDDGVLQKNITVYDIERCSSGDIKKLIETEWVSPNGRKYFFYKALLEKFDAGASIAMIEYWILSGRIE
jgi:hypothetical protein